MQLRLLGGPFGLLQLVLVEHGLLVDVGRRGRHHVAARVAPRGAGQLLGGLLEGGRLGQRRGLREGLLGGLVVGGRGRGGVACGIIAGVAEPWERAGSRRPRKGREGKNLSGATSGAEQ